MEGNPVVPRAEHRAGTEGGEVHTHTSWLPMDGLVEFPFSSPTWLCAGSRSACGESFPTFILWLELPGGGLPVLYNAVHIWSPAFLFLLRRRSSFPVVPQLAAEPVGQLRCIATRRAPQRAGTAGHPRCFSPIPGITNRQHGSRCAMQCGAARPRRKRFLCTGWRTTESLPPVRPSCLPGVPLLRAAPNWRGGGMARRFARARERRRLRQRLDAIAHMQNKSKRTPAVDFNRDVFSSGLADFLAS